MPRAKISSVERRKAQVAGGVVLMVLRALPESGTAELLRELIDMTLVDAEDRALFDFLGGRATVSGVCRAARPTKCCGN
jgi:hypothetical protein